jgi:hypothetical protein
MNKTYYMEYSYIVNYRLNVKILKIKLEVKLHLTFLIGSYVVDLRVI